MAIPGTSFTSLDVRAKVRIGEKKVSKGGKEYPSAVEEFLCDDSEFAQQYPQRPTELTIRLPYAEPEDCFPTGLEWWKGATLACYTHDGSDDPTALRVTALEVKEGGGKKTLSWLDADDEVRGPVTGRGRTPIKCRFRECRHFGTNANNKECKPKARLDFLLAGGRTDAVLRFETGSWNTIEQVASTLAAARLSGPLNASDRRWSLKVAMVAKGENRYPVVTIEEVGVEVKTQEDVRLADALIQLRAKVDSLTEQSTEQEIASTKEHLGAVLDLKRPGWRENPEPVVKWVAEAGLRGAAEQILGAHDL